MDQDFRVSLSLFITNVASQLLNRCIDVPDGSAALSDSGTCFVERSRRLSVDNWRHVLSQPQVLWDLPWLRELFSKKPELIDRISYHCHDEITSISARGALLVLYNSIDYPALLREIEDPPAAITVVGNPKILNANPAAIVGARKAGGIAIRESFQLGKCLAEHGRTIVSGGAFGCDIAAHQGVLSTALNPAPAVVVFAGGLCSTYPKANEFVFRQVVERGGALLSERLWWAPPKPRDFLTRNRIVSGMCSDIFVMQAGDRSGALVTARSALDQGREVWVLEHQPHDIRATGGSGLIRDGAASFANTQNLEELLRPTDPIGSIVL